MFSIFGLVWMMFIVAGFSVQATGMALLPEKFPFNIWELLGWAFMLGGCVSWELARK